MVLHARLASLVIVFGVLAIKQPNVPLAIQPETGEQLLNEYDDCMAARRPYEVP